MVGIAATILHARRETGVYVPHVQGGRDRGIRPTCARRERQGYTSHMCKEGETGVYVPHVQGGRDRGIRPTCACLRLCL